MSDWRGYTNTNNPYGDPRLTEKFVWGKNVKRIEETSGLTKKEIQAREGQKKRENAIELQKLNEERLQREREAYLKNEERKKREKEKFREEDELVEQGDERFLLQQSVYRSQLRLEQKRPLPIDLLQQYVKTEAKTTFDERVPDKHFVLRSPEAVIQKASNKNHSDYLKRPMTDQELKYDHPDALEDLKADIHIYINLGVNLGYWKNCLNMVQHELKEHDMKYSRSVRDHGYALSSDTQAKIVSALSMSTYDQLIEIKKKSAEKIAMHQRNPASREFVIDVPYWKRMSELAEYYLAVEETYQVYIDYIKNQYEIYSDIMQTFPNKYAAYRKFVDSNQFVQNYELLTRFYKHASELSFKSELASLEFHATHAGAANHQTEETGGVPVANKPNDEDNDTEEEEEEEEDEEEAVAGDDDLYSLPGIDEQDLAGLGVDIEDIELDVYNTLIIKMRNDLIDKLHIINIPKQRVGADPVVAATAASDSTKKEDLKEEVQDAEHEFALNREVVLLKKRHLWEEQYTPRKPRYINRVQTGFEWNKYNQTHFDAGSFPPKIVQGYRFNIMYPDLIDIKSTPEFTLRRRKDTPDFVTIVFSAGPPYEDIGFKIVDREWDRSPRTGYVCEFTSDKVLRLHFRFKRGSYRR